MAVRETVTRGIMVRIPLRCWICVRLSIILVGLLLTLGALAAVATVQSDGPTAVALPLPDQVLYPWHALLGAALNQAGLSPSRAAIQWVKAASHARTAGDVAWAAWGIAEARSRARARPDLDARLCALFKHGAPAVRDAITQSGIICPDAGG